MSYVPLVIPPFVGTPTFATTANWVASVAQPIAESSQSFMNDLAELKSIDFSQMGNLPVFNSVVWLGTNPGSVARPTRPTISFNITSLLAQLGALVAPTAPVDTFSYTEPGYTSALRPAMLDKLLTDLLNGGYGIDTNDEIALFNRERDREVLATRITIEEVKRQSAETGFTMPQGAMYLALQKARQEQLAKLSSVNRDIGLKRADLYVQHRERVITQVLATEEQSIGLYNAIQNRAVQIAQVEVQLSIAIFDAGIKLFQAQQQALISQIEAQIESARAQVSIYASDVQAYAAYVNALVAGAQIDIANSQNLLKRDIQAHQSRADIVRFQLQQLATTVEARKAINQFGVEFFRTALGAALNNVNGVATSTQEV